MIEKDPGRLAILKKIDEYELNGWFSKDVEDDPPTIPLMPDMVDYLCENFSSKIKMKFANFCARNHIKKLMKNKQLIIKETIGMENYLPLEKKGAVITCNHFNAFDNFAIYKVLEKHIHKRELYKVCREGNFTSFPGLYGWFFRNCNTLPLSSNVGTMKKFLSAVKTLLARNEKILIYPEQGMWWNYRKPRPTEPGAYKIAAMNKVPIIPLFITMNDSELIGGDGFPIQEYTVHILPAIYPKEDAGVKENCEYLQKENYKVCKEVYEKVYGIPLVYDGKNYTDVK